MKEHVMTKLVETKYIEDSKLPSYSCKYMGTGECKYICPECKYMQAILAKVALLEELESDVCREEGCAEVLYE